MNTKIYKYVLKPFHLTHEIPGGGIIRYVAEQNDNICLWIEVEPDAKVETRRFVVFGTGHEIWYDQCQMNYVGTVKMKYDDLIFHVYEKLNNSIKVKKARELKKKFLEEVNDLLDTEKQILKDQLKKYFNNYYGGLND